MHALNTRITASVYYDSDCRLCIQMLERFDRVLARRHFECVPLQTPGTATLVGIAHEQLLDEMRLRLPDGTVYGGADAVVEIARRIWWAWPLWALSRLPGAVRPMRGLYRWIARHRGCADGVCEIQAPSPSRLPGVLPLVILPIVAWLMAPQLPRWGAMWAMAFALYAGCKWLTYTRVPSGVVTHHRSRALAYLFAWPGMDATAFLRDNSPVEQPSGYEWAIATLKTFLGVCLIWFAVRQVLPVDPLLAGWVGMIGAVFVLHFGTFHLVSLGWRSLGVDAMPVMRSPMRSTSLAEFWGRRWNTAFHELASRFTFRPLRHRVGATAATLLVFVASGLIHELVISVPARGAYGLPTGYFVLQGLGIASERTAFGRRLGLAHGWRGWLFTLAVVAGPAFWLFPPLFVRQVILPMLAVIGAA